MSQEVMSTSRLQHLPPSCKQLIRKMQEIRFGRIAFAVAGGLPDLARRWRIQRTVKLASSENGPGAELHLTDFELCREQLTLLETVRGAADGEQLTIEVRHGLPFIVQIEKDQQVA